MLINVKARTRKTTPIHVWVGRMDYNNTISSKVNIDAGLMTSISKFTNDVYYGKLVNSSWEVDPAFSALYKLNEYIYAAYGNLNIQVDRKTNIKTGLRYEHTKSNSAKVDPANNKQIFTGENLKSMNTASATISLPFTIAPWWNMQNNLMAVWQHAKTTYNSKPVELQNFYYRITTSQNFKLPKDYAIELSGFYQSPSLRGRSKYLAYGTLNFGAQKKLGVSLINRTKS